MIPSPVIFAIYSEDYVIDEHHIYFYSSEWHKQDLIIYKDGLS